MKGGSRERYNQGMAPARPYKRLTRSAHPRPHRMTPRDRELMALVARFRNLDSHQIARLDGGSPRGVRNRLNVLFDHGYLSRPKQQHILLATFFDEGNRALVYGLKPKAVRHLVEHGNPIATRLNWAAKKTDETVIFLAHTLEIADAMLEIHFACAAAGAPRLLDHYDLLPFFPEDRREASDPFRLRVTVTQEMKSLSLSVVPDRLFSLVYPDNTRHNFVLERDRGTMQVWSRNLVRKSSWRLKIIGYYEAWKQGRHTEAFGFRGYRVATVTTSEARIAAMLKAQLRVTRGQANAMFLYTTPERLKQHGVFGPAWISADSDRVSILPARSPATPPKETVDA